MKAVSAALAMLAVVLITIGLAVFSTRRARTTADFFVAARAVPPWWNASAISGEYLSAASFLGIAGLVMLGGADALWFPVGYAVGFVLLLALVAAPLRRSGAYTVPDFAEARLASRGARLATSVAVVAIGWLYLVPQLQGAGLALRVLLGTPIWVGGLVVAATVLAVLASGGMRTATLVQGVQYWMKLFAIAVPVVFLIAAWHGAASPDVRALAEAKFLQPTTVSMEATTTLQVEAPTEVVAVGQVDGLALQGPLLMAPGRHAVEAGTTLAFPTGAAVPTPVDSQALSGPRWAFPLEGSAEHSGYRSLALMIALFFGTMGLPHILVRLYTNPDGRAARRTAATVVGLVGLFYLAPTVYGALGRLFTPELMVTGSSDAVVLLLPQRAIGGVGGQLLGALVAAGAAAAFITTATGLTVSVTGVLSQDLMGRFIPEPVRAFRLAAVPAVLVPLLLGFVAARLPLASAVSLAFTVAATTIAPLLLLGIWWRRLTALGAVAGLAVGGVLSLAAIGLATLAPSTSGWLSALLAQPAAWVLPLSVAAAVLVSLLTPDRARPDVWRFMVRLHTPETLEFKRSRPQEQAP